MSKRLICSLLILLSTSLLTAQELRLRASVNRNQVTDQDRLTFTVDIEGVSDFPDIPPPESPDFVVISGPSHSSSIQIINGQMSASQTITWQIAPTRTGQLQIPPISIRYKGKSYQTNAVPVTVSTARTRAPSGAPSAPPADTPAPPATSDEVILRASVPQNSIFKGEQLLVTFELFFRNVRAYDVKKLPEAQGFWVENYPVNDRPVITNETLNGVAYKKAILRQMALFPTTTGELTIDPLVIECEVLVSNQRRRSIFDDFFNDPFFGDPFGTTSRMVTARSAPVKIRVQPLPEDGRPAGFSGAVGQYRIESRIDTLRTRQDQALTLRYIVQGAGNINALQLPPPQLPNTVEVFAPKINKQIDNSGKTIRGTLTYEYVLIPRQPGLLTIPAIIFSYFDPQTRRYCQLPTRSYAVQVLPGDQLATRSTGLNKSEVAMLGQDIRYIYRNSSHWQTRGENVLYRAWFWGLNSLALLIVLIAVGWRWWTDKLATDNTFARRRRAWMLAQERLQPLGEDHTALDHHLCLARWQQALVGYIADRLGLPAAGLGQRELTSALQHQKSKPELIERTARLLEELEAQRFAPTALTPEACQEFFQRTQELVKQLSRVL